MKVRKSDLKKYLEICETTSNLLASFEESVLLWGMRKEKVLGPYNTFIRKKRTLVESLPERWHNLATAQVAAGQVFIYPRRIRKYLHNHRDTIRTEEKALLQFFVDEPWIYAAVYLKEVLESDFYNVIDSGTGEELLLHSPTLHKLFHSGARMYLLLLFYNGVCWQTFGPLHYYRGYQPYDFHYFAKQLSPQFYNENGLSATIASNPAAFLLLDTSTENPPFAHRGQIVQICVQQVSMDSFDPQAYSEHFNLNEKEEILQCKLKGPDNPFVNAALYYDGNGRKLLVRTTRLELYQEIRDILAGDIDLPEEPYWMASMNMYIATRRILDKDVPGEHYLQMFEEDQDPVSPEAQLDLDTLNRVVAEVSRCRNHGISYTAEEIASKHNVELEFVRQAEQMYNSSVSKFDLKIAGGLDGYQPPSPVIRRLFHSSPWENGMFIFLDSPRVRKHFAALQPELGRRFSGRKIGPFQGPPKTLDELPRWFEELYFTTQEQRDFALLNITLHLLCNRGKELEAVRDYAVEVLRLYWQVFVQSKEPENLEIFVEKFSLFCFEVLYKGGLVNIDPVVGKRAAADARFSMGPSAFLRAWISLVQDAPA